MSKNLGKSSLYSKFSLNLAILGKRINCHLFPTGYLLINSADLNIFANSCIFDENNSENQKLFPDNAGELALSKDSTTLNSSLAFLKALLLAIETSFGNVKITLLVSLNLKSVVVIVLSYRLMLYAEVSFCNAFLKFQITANGPMDVVIAVGSFFLEFRLILKLAFVKCGSLPV
ncbi:hypothetical protein OGAPHI_006864 [Ogataea philodendri]|uniref:Uncharacterized protein n=1 Tax=Ogataea philodendri TaxID=1378263 RepID=A0A9P8NTW4_9ASCO|nr:uncharacterized protein OGAPHI_006864 [Ogataea philodendri]KAH3660278.1 hypothetical protein OGAPHI_006864 [Ogataea philodendri]